MSSICASPPSPVMAEPDLVNHTLVIAARLHAVSATKHDDWVGIPSYARVTFRANIPDVIPTVLKHTPLLSMDAASEAGNTKLLDTWMAMSHKLPPLQYTDAAMNASTEGHVHVLQWWVDSGLKIKYSQTAMHGASWKGHVCVLEWWKQSGFKLQYWEHVVDGASMHGKVDVLEWWKRSGLHFDYSDAAVDGASENGHVHVLEWWRKSGLEIIYSEKSMDLAANVDVLEWWLRASGLDLEYTDIAMREASAKGSIEMLDWWIHAGLKIKYDDEAMGAATSHGQVHVLDWWRHKSGLELKVPEESIIWGSIHKRLGDDWVLDDAVLAWWRDSGLVEL